MPDTFHPGRIAGIDIHIHLSWFIACILLVFSLGATWYVQLEPEWTFESYWLSALLSALLLCICLLLHELAHIFVARFYRLRIKSLHFFIFGAFPEYEQERYPQKPGQHIAIALAGPLVSALLGTIFYLLSLPLRGTHLFIEAICDFLYTMNLLLALLNLLPGLPLDGGQILHQLLWKKTSNRTRATTTATGIGLLLAYALILLGIVSFFISQATTIIGLWTAFMGWFLLSASQWLGHRHHSGIQQTTVRQALVEEPLLIPSHISLYTVINDYFQPHAHESALVVQNSQFAGIITLEDIRRVERSQWPHTPVSYVMRLADQLHTVQAEQSLYDALELMITHNLHYLAVIEGTCPIGLLSRKHVARQLQASRLQGAEIVHP
ncbi:Zn-dependent protease [Thermosporothrix hazakensis]|jgi:Zn-dependent protease/CBS domain-containing protein|uniref:Zinc metalloprotease n=2 Tax=Thermosporothrix TaxID=768650 RepID=A0A326U6E0_THEHA|nr:site-2 protease family protein [Thermosporothrix hazakensis]PZW29531.1 Zn-dependent protease [Thermosporothrix hazakensis]BBH85817.1 peptidase M50 [Thermosporothrix sp. COM3]GCE45754.1 peptidase M50 [Thermosporothrix hazakensis]